MLMSNDTSNASVPELQDPEGKRQRKSIHKDERIRDKMMRLPKDKAIPTKELKNEA